MRRGIENAVTSFCLDVDRHFVEGNGTGKLDDDEVVESQINLVKERLLVQRKARSVRKSTCLRTFSMTSELSMTAAELPGTMVSTSLKVPGGLCSVMYVSY